MVPKGFMTAYQNYRQINFRKFINESSSEIDLAVFYYDSWINTYTDELKAFIQKPGSIIRIYLTDPEMYLYEISKFFPENSDQVLKEKILRTAIRTKNLFKEMGADTNRLEVYFLPRMLSYSLQMFDNKYFLESVFDMYRDNQRIDSSAYLWNLKKSNGNKRKWVQKQFENMRRDGKLIDIKKFEKK